MRMEDFPPDGGNVVCMNVYETDIVSLVAERPIPAHANENRGMDIGKVSRIGKVTLTDTRVVNIIILRKMENVLQEIKKDIRVARMVVSIVSIHKGVLVTVMAWFLDISGEGKGIEAITTLQVHSISIENEIDM